MSRVLTKHVMEDNIDLYDAMFNLSLELEELEDKVNIISISHDKTYVDGIWFVTALISFTKD